MARPPLVTIAITAFGGSLALMACDGLFHRGDLPSLDRFEGELDFLVKRSFAKAGAEPATVSVFIKGDRLRFDPPATDVNGGGSFLLDSPAKRFYVVNPARREAIEFDMSADRSRAASGAAVTKTGRKSTVLGFRCEEWDVLEADQKKETVCVADTPASFFEVPVSEAMLGSHVWMSQVFDGKHVPLRLVTFDRAGAETGRIELTKILREPEDASQFVVPEGFETVDVGKLLRGKASPLRGGAAAGSGVAFPDTQPLKIHARPSHS